MFVCHCYITNVIFRYAPTSYAPTSQANVPYTQPQEFPHQAYPGTHFQQGPGNPYSKTYNPNAQHVGGYPRMN